MNTNHQINIVQILLSKIYTNLNTFETRICKYTHIIHYQRARIISDRTKLNNKKKLRRIYATEFINKNTKKIIFASFLNRLLYTHKIIANSNTNTGWSKISQTPISFHKLIWIIKPMIVILT